ncbi:hypothetical protein Tco_0152919 [Tanacetum coccineum]
MTNPSSDNNSASGIEDKLDYLEKPIPHVPVPSKDGQQVALEARATHAAWELKTLFAQQAEQELLQTNYNMHIIGKTINELHAMLKLHEQTLPKNNAQLALYAIRAGKGKNKIAYAPKPKIPPVPKREDPTTDSINSLITQEASGSLEDLEIIQKEDTYPSIDTSLHHEEDDLEIDKPQSDIIPIRRSTRTQNSPNRMCLYIDAE